MGGLDVLVSNAGVEYFGPLAGITEDDVRRVFDTNVAGQLYAVQAAVPLMTGGGRIVLMSSVSAASPSSSTACTRRARRRSWPWPATWPPSWRPGTSPSTPSRPAAPPPTWPPRTPRTTPPRCCAGMTCPRHPDQPARLARAPGRARGDRGRDRVPRLARRGVPQWLHAGRRRRLDVAGPGHYAGLLLPIAARLAEVICRHLGLPERPGFSAEGRPRTSAGCSGPRAPRRPYGAIAGQGVVVVAQAK